MNIELLKLLRTPKRREILAYISNFKDGIYAGDLSRQFPDVTNISSLLRPARACGVCKYDQKRYYVTLDDTALLTMDDAIAWALSCDVSRIIIMEIVNEPKTIEELRKAAEKEKGSSEYQVRSTIREMKNRKVAYGVREDKKLKIYLNRKYTKLVREIFKKELP